MNYPLTAKQWSALYLNANPLTIAKYLDGLNAAAVEFELTTPLRLAHFVSQTGHESGSLKYVREIWGPTPAQIRYEGRSDLGNTVKGDGRKFCGRGPIQITGRANYTACGHELGIDLVNHPELAETPEHTFRVAGWFWRRNHLNAIADADDGIKMTRRINGGLNGLADRLKRLEHAKAALGIAEPQPKPASPQGPAKAPTTAAK